MCVYVILRREISRGGSVGEKESDVPEFDGGSNHPVTKPGKGTDVCCEDFIQWVIEDNFIAGRPAWEKVGVTFTHDVTPYEIMKLSLLNASHTLLLILPIWKDSGRSML